MRIPDSLVPLVDHGVVDEVIRSLKSGKEADVYLVASEGFYRVAKVYKDAQSRSFKNRAAYTEGREVRSSRDQRAMDKGSKYGRAQNEAAWQSAEVDMIYRLDSAGVRVPKPHHFIDGVLIMELVASPEGDPAPRLGELEFSAEDAKLIFDKLLADVVKMLCAGVVHGDLSEFNVLVGAEGPVVIDFPQSVNAARNQNARKMLLRDVENLQNFLKKYVPGTPTLRYAEEMWQLYEKGELTPTSQLTGRYVDDAKAANTSAVLGLIEDARRDERFKRQLTGKNLRGLGSGAPREVDVGARPAPHAPHAPRAPHATAGNHGGASNHPPGHPRPPHAQHPRPPHAQGQPRPQQAPHTAHAPAQPHQARPPHTPNPPRPPPSPSGPRPHSAPNAAGDGAQRPPRPQHAQQHPRPPNPQGQPHAPRPPQANNHARPAPNGNQRRPDPRPQRPPHAPHEQRQARPPVQPPRGPRGRPNPRPTPIVETRPQLGGVPGPRPAPPREPGQLPPGQTRK